MKKPIVLLFHFLIAMLFSGCLEIVEDVTAHSDGSGKFSFTLNMSQSRNKLNSIMLLDSLNGYKVPGKPEINEYINKVEKALINSKGISSVKVSRDMVNFVFSVRFSFDRAEYLNRALESVRLAVDPKSKTALGTIYTFNGKVFERTESYFKTIAFKNANNNQLAAFSAATYTGIYRFDRAVKKVTNPAAKLSASGKAVMLKSNIPLLIKRKTSFATIIELK